MKLRQHVLAGIAILLCSYNLLLAQTNSSAAAESNDLLVEELFELAPQNTRITKEFVANANFLTLDRTTLRKLNIERPDRWLLQIPTESGETLELDLFQSHPLSDDFYVTNQDGEPIDYEAGLYYHGYLRSDPSSMVALSLFDSQVHAVFAVKGQTWVLGHLGQDKFPAGDDYILYDSKNLLVDNPRDCASDELPVIDGKIIPDDGEKGFNECKIVEIYFEADYRTYLDNGSSENETTNFVTAMFNVVALLYDKESVDTRISAVKVWTSDDNYPTSSSTAALYSFRSRLGGSFDGDIAQLLSTAPVNNGGVAFVGVLCTPSYAVSYSNIRNSFSTFPTYSWTVEVVTHELGHNLGSPHTHSCSWPGGAIDGCYPAEGGCQRGPSPSGGGTIMSYCHLTSAGINFNKGFGPLPGNLIRSKVNAASCLNVSADNCNDDGGDDDDGGGGDDGSDDDDDDDDGNYGKANLTKASDNLVTLGLEVTASVIVTNKGQVRSAPCQLAFYLSTDNSFSPSSDYFVGSKPVPRLQRGENFGVTFDADLGDMDVPVGNYYLGYIIDAADEVDETVEGDNTWYWINPRFPLTGGGGDDDDDDDDNGGGDGDGDGGDEPTYCESYGDDVKYEWIARVAVGDIDNETARDRGYGDYTELSTDLERGSTPTIRLAPGFRRQEYMEQWMVWIDFNKDMDFDDAGELVFQGEEPTKEAISGRLTIPGDVPQGETRMRVSMKWYDEDDEIQKSCSTFGYGEVEDYTVNIIGDAVESCALNSVTPADQSDCDPLEMTYYQEIRMSYEGNPTEIIAKIGDRTFTFDATGSPQHIRLDSLMADGADVSLHLQLTSDGGCDTEERFENLFTAPEPCEATCDVPTPLGVSIAGRNISIEWEEGALAEYYQIRYRPAGEIEWTYKTSREGMYDATDLEENATYEYQIRTNCGELGWSDWSEVYVFVTPGRCGIPSPRSVDLLSGVSVRVNWYPMPRARAYRIRWREFDTEDWQEREVNTIRAELTDLMASTVYEYQLSAKCGTTWAGWSAIYVFMTPSAIDAPTTFDVETEEELTFSVFPNPASDVLNIAINRLSDQRVQIRNSNGQLIQEVYLNNNNNQLNISGLKPGIYFVQVIDDQGQIQAQRFVKY
ncbi:MAG: M12 family metallo-peptidase [Bacteroidota bacterium]